MRRRARERQEKREDKRSILKRLRAALLRSFRGQHGEKMVCVGGSTRGNWDPREGQQPFRLNQKGVGEGTTTLRRMMIGEVQFRLLWVLYILQKFPTSLFKKISVNTCFGDRQKVCIDD